MEYIFEHIMPLVVHAIELLGALIIILGVAKASALLVKSGFNFRNEDLIVELASTLSISLEYILAAEVLKTLIVQDMQQLLLLGVLLILRIIITFVLHWELEHIDKKQHHFDSLEK